MDEEIKVNRNCVNAKIQAHILSEPEMRKTGFTDHGKDNWYFCRMLPFLYYLFPALYRLCTILANLASTITHRITTINLESK